jgi:hypothetical protein
VTQPQRRIFVYKPPPPERDAPEIEPSEETDILRAWLLTPVGAIIVWILTLGMLAPVAVVMLLILPEAYAQLAAGFGLWLILGLTAIHWWLPPGSQETQHSEGLAVAGWHILISAVITGGFAWLLLFPDGRRPSFLLADLVPVVVVGGIVVVMFGVILTLLRGYLPGKGLRLSWTMLCMLSVWMTLWLVAAHAGL